MSRVYVSTHTGNPRPGQGSSTSRRNQSYIHPNSSFSINCTNIRGLSKNFNCVQQYIEVEHPDVLFLTETQVNRDCFSDQYLISNYRLENSFDFKHGLCVYINNNVAYSRLSKFEINCAAYNTLVLKISLSRKDIIVVGVYRSPNCKYACNFFENMTEKMDEIIKRFGNAELVITGDFNVHNRDWLGLSSHNAPNQAGKKAQLFASGLNLTQMVKEATFYPGSLGHEGHILDLYLTSMPNITTVKVKPKIGNSDHELVESKVSLCKCKRSKTVPRRIWHYKKMNYNGLQKFFQAYPWEKSCLHKSDPNKAAQIFTEVISHGMRKFIPSSLVLPKAKKQFSKQARTASALKQKAFNLYLLNKTNEHRHAYKAASKTCKEIIDREKSKFNAAKAEKLSNCPTGTRQFWQMAKSVKSNFTTSSLPPLKSNGKIIVESVEKANSLAAIFAANSTRNLSLLEKPHTLPSSGFSMKTIVFRNCIIKKYLQELDVKKSTGPDGIPSKILKTFSSELAPIITKIFHLSYKKGIFPKCWKASNIHPIPKKGDHSDPSNYRPIAIIPVIAKVFERYVNHNIKEFIEASKIVDDKQYGFRSNRSTGDLLAYVTHKWNNAMENHGESFAVALDIAKAFDRVWHENLLAKLESYGIHDETICWLNSYLGNRSFRVVVDGTFSNEFHTNSGVPQGSVLSPTLFLLYINDLLKSTANPIHSFADDSTLHATHCYSSQNSDVRRVERNSVVSSMNEDLYVIMKWGERNSVNFNASKTQLCEISRLKHKVIEKEITFALTPLKKNSSVRLLGLNISSNLLWHDHIMDIAKQAAKKIGFLYRCKSFFNAHQLCLIYKSFIRPCMEYCCHIWGAAAKSSLDLLDRVQKRAIRLINNTEITDRLDSLQHRRDVADLSIFYKYIYGKCSKEVYEIMPPREKRVRDTRAGTNAHCHAVILETVRTTKFQNDFFTRTAKKWNKMPASAFPLNYNIQSFKTNVHKFLKIHPFN